MNTFHLAAEFVDGPAEEGLLAALARTPALYWQLVDALPVGTFVCASETWEAVARAMEADQSPTVPPDWVPAADPAATAGRLADLAQRRLLAAAQERIAAALYEPTQPAESVRALWDTEAARLQQAAQARHGTRLQWAADLVTPVLAEAAQRQQQREATGRPAIGTPTGLAQLDDLLGGWQPGVHLLAGGPGKGKTTLALQFALHAARAAIPALYVTYENSPASLVVKALGAQAGVPASDVAKGFGEVSQLRDAAATLQPLLKRLALVEGTPSLAVAQIRAQAAAARATHHAERCFVVLDYLQPAAHGRGYDQLRANIGRLIGELRDLATRLDSPVLALSSQSRERGQYGSGGGSAALDSLKESGDLEYAADTVLFLVDDEASKVPPPARAVHLKVEKNRHGETGAVALHFRPDVGLFREVTRR